LLFAPFSPYFEAASCAGQSPHEPLALRGPATIHWMVAAYLSMFCEAASKSDKKCIKNQM